LKAPKRDLTAFLSDPKIMGTGPIMLAPVTVAFPFLRLWALAKMAATARTKTPMKINAKPTTKKPAEYVT
jgi:hypothetical protein